MRCSIDRRDVEKAELAGLNQFLAQLIADAHQPIPFIGPRSIHLTLKAGSTSSKSNTARAGGWARVGVSALASASAA